MSDRTSDWDSFTRTIQTPAGPSPYPVGATLSGKYKILEEVGRGGMGVVYKAEDVQLRRTVALKFLSPDSPLVPSREKRLTQEAQAASALNHPNICTIYEIGEAGGNSFIAMEYVEGRTLDRMIPPGGLSPADVLRFGRQLVEGFEHAHKKGVIHRDLKSANVMITTDGRVKILDFGLAKRLAGEEIGEAARSKSSLTEEGMIAGTLPYLAPETLRGHPADARSDIWALGVVLYEMAAGKRPFEGRTGFDLTSSILRDAPAPLPAEIPPGLRAVVGKCLEKNPARRFQTAGEVRAASEADIPAKGARISGLSSIVRRRWGRWALAAVALCIVGTVILFIAPRGGEKPAKAKDRDALSTGARPSAFAEANEYFEKAMLFLRAQFNLPSARKMLERALEIDPHFAEARAWYGFSFILEIDSGRSNDSKWLYRAEQELRSALEDDPDSARSHASLAALYFYQGRKDLMPGEVDKALALNPVETDAKIWGANYYSAGEDNARAKELVNQTLEADPLFFPARMVLGDILRTEGDTDGAIREQGKILEQDPHSPYASQKMARAYIDRNDLAAARRYLENVSPEDQRAFEVKMTWALLLALEGKTDEAREKMDEEALAYGSLAPWSTSLVAEFYAITGEAEKSLDWLEKAVRNGDERAGWFRRDPLLAKVRDLPRFGKIIDSIEFRRKTVR